jgi:hypothetical protein
MTAIDHTQRPARIVYDLEDRVLPDVSPRQPSGPLYIEDFLALATSLKAAGYDVGDQVQRIEDINAAIDAMLAGQGSHSLDDIDLMTAETDDIAERLRQAGIDRAANLEIINQRNGFAHSLARAAADQVRAYSDQIIKAMRKRFDPAVKVVKAAAERGLTQHTNMAELVDLAAPEVIEAYRALGPAVAELDAVANLRNQLTSVARIGPTDYPMAAFVTDVGTALDLEGARNIWTGESEVVQHDLPFLGSHLATVRRKRLGGAWLALICGGYKLRLNTGPEAQAVVTAALRGDR